MTTDRTRFNESWLNESPEGIESTDTYGAVVYNIRDLLNSGATVLSTTEPNVKKIELTNSIYYWIVDNDKIQLAVELEKSPENVTVRLSGKDQTIHGKSPYADELYQVALKDSGKPLLFSDNKLSNDGKRLWRRLVSAGNNVTVYDAENPGQSRVTIGNPEDLEKFWKMNDPAYKRWRYVLSESGMMTLDLVARFNTRRAREITRMGTLD